MDAKRCEIKALRLSQVGVACIPVVIGLLALVNNITNFSDTVESVVKPLISMQGNVANGWRGLPSALAPFVFFGMFIAESLVGLFAVVGVCKMVKNICNDNFLFQASKTWVYFACGWGLLVWGLGFFEIGGDWFLAWQNSKLTDFQSGAVMYVQILIAVFLYLKMSNE